MGAGDSECWNPDGTTWGPREQQSGAQTARFKPQGMPGGESFFHARVVSATVAPVMRVEEHPVPKG